jgi:hypothetical protein
MRVKQPETAIRQLEALIVTATNAKLSESILDMTAWKTIHECGYAACLIGYQSLSKNLKEFPCADASDYTTTRDMCETITDDLDASLGYALSRSIWEGGDREGYAECSGMFSIEEISTFSHLRKGSTSFDSAIYYMSAIIAKIKTQKGGRI